MTDPVADLIAKLDVERLEENLFRGHGDGGESTKRVFGGLVIAQALTAAVRTVADDRPCHSLHAYFLRPGDPTIPIVYEVDRARDGGSFTTRRVVAIQRGRQIFNMAASFQIQEPGWEHQHDMPDVPAPESLPERQELRLSMADRVPEHLREDFLRPRALEIREVEPLDQVDPKPLPDRNAMWFRVPSPEGVREPALHQCLLAYASDMNLLGAGARPHGVGFMTGQAMFASLDHAMWFHGPLDFSDWHLYAIDSPFAGGARSVNRGQIFDRGGRLVASTAQEGLMRPLTKRG